MYVPRQVPPGPMADFLQQEFDLIARESMGPSDVIQLRKLYAAPAKPREGMVVLADGTSWNPGGGQGFYGYYASAWNKLG